MSSIGICGLISDFNNLTYEKSELYSEAQKKFDQVYLIDPKQINYKFIKGEKKPHIIYQDNNLSSLNSIIIRDTKDQEAATAVLVRSLKICGCDIFDPIERFSVGKASKLLTTISRFQKEIGTSTYISFTRIGAKSLLTQLDKNSQFPLLTKPIDGKQGNNVIILVNLKEGLEYINNFYKDKEYLADPFFLQNFISIEKEYRIIVIDGKAIGIAEKIRLQGKIVSNAAQGATFIKVEAPDVINEVIKNVSNKGILGVDVAIDTKGQMHIIETNRAPQWQAFEKATNINVAEALIKRAVERIK